MDKTKKEKLRKELQKLIENKDYNLKDPYSVALEWLKELYKRCPDLFPVSQTYIDMVYDEISGGIEVNKYLAYEAFIGKQNPLCFWRIYFECRKAKKQIPEEVLDYFDTVAEKICHLANNPPKSSKMNPKELSKALGLYSDNPGRNSYFESYQKYLKEGSSWIPGC